MVLMFDNICIQIKEDFNLEKPLFIYYQTEQFKWQEARS
jgi:anaerobic ribonucleoside-triphosphate reductase